MQTNASTSTSALDVYREHFKDITPSCIQQNELECLVTDMDRWRETCRFWVLNDYRPKSIGKMINHYEQQLTKHSPKPRLNIHVGKNEHACGNCSKADCDSLDCIEILAKRYAPPPCDICGKAVCFSNHDAERRAL